jgi:glyoxylase I family protein
VRPVARVSVVYLYVRDLDRSLAFYRDLLGIALERDPRDEHWAEATFPDGVRFALHRTTGFEPTTPNTVRISFEVAEVESIAERLSAAGVQVGDVRRAAWGTLCELVDPDGYEIGLFAPPVG